MFQVLLSESSLEKLNLEKKVNTLSSRLATTLSQLQDERQISKALTQNQTAWQTKFNNLELQFKEYKETKDQVNISLLITAMKHSPILYCYCL